MPMAGHAPSTVYRSLPAGVESKRFWMSGRLERLQSFAGQSVSRNPIADTIRLLRGLAAGGCGTYGYPGRWYNPKAEVKPNIQDWEEA